MNKSKLAKQQAQLEKLNAQIKEEKNAIDKKIGHKLIDKLKLDYTNLNKETINKLIDTLAHLYNSQNNKENNHHD